MLQYYTYALKPVTSCDIIICGDGFVMQSNMHLSETTPTVTNTHRIYKFNVEVLPKMTRRPMQLIIKVLKHCSVIDRNLENSMFPSNFSRI